LTVEGVLSVKDAAYVIDADLNIAKQTYGEKHNVMLTCFVSDLVRTRQTLNSMSDVLKSKYRSEPIVLPCASEVAKVGKNGDCDSAGSFLDKMALENYPDCKLDQLNKTGKCRAIWELYLEFYGNRIRGSDTYGTSRMKCRDTNMLALAIYLLEFRVDGMSLTDFMKGSTEEQNKLTNDPLPDKMINTRTGFFNWSYGGTKRRKLKRKRTRHIR
jgi:hypothetical protein